MNSKKIMLLLFLFVSIISFSAVEIKLVDVNVNEGIKERNENRRYKVTTKIDGNVSKETHFLLKTEKKSSTTVKTLYVDRRVMNNRNGKIKSQKKTLEKVYQLEIKYNKEGKVKKVLEKSYVIDLNGKVLIMYVPIKILKSMYKYYTPEEKKKLKTKKNGILALEKFYRKIFYHSGEKSALKFEEIISKLIPESKIREYNVLDLGILKDEIMNEDKEQIFLRGKIEF
ncbi:MAG: hypothetical protein WBG30_13145 [Psychrilyobacter sp.]|uniref:hypothetical protein n=1 Tax=Psychrilyobacter sp. TaxID=2586924 RepID=UPI003C71C5E3